MRVEVYRNLHADCFSVRALEGPHKGRVIDRVQGITIRYPQFVVQPGGRARVRRDKRKVVHAFVRGDMILSGDGLEPKPGAEAASYNPYQNKTFIWKADGSKLTAAAYATLRMVDGHSEIMVTKATT